MARKKKASRKAKPMQVVSLKAALHMVKTAERRIRARKMPRKNPELGCGPMPNPKRHYPKLEGRGRPQKKRTFKLTTELSNGAKGHSKMRGTRSQAEVLVNRILRKRYMGKAVKQVILDDGK